MYETCQYKSEWREQYQQFLRVLTSISSMKDSHKFTSMDILILLLATEAKRYQGCELVMDIITRAATLMSVESEVESWISVLEHHSNKRRPLGDESIQSELMIALNGPKVQHCQGVVEEAMETYWRRTKVSDV